MDWLRILFGVLVTVNALVLIGTINVWGVLCFAMAGLSLVVVGIEEVRNLRK